MCLSSDARDLHTAALGGDWGEWDVLSHLGEGFNYCSQGSLSILPAWSSSSTGSGASSLVAWLQDPFQFCCEVVGLCNWEMISFLQLGGGVRERGQKVGEAKRIRVSQVSSGVGLRLGCGCFGQSHQGPSGSQAHG